MILILQRLALGAYALATVLALLPIVRRQRPVLIAAPLVAAAGLALQMLVIAGVGGPGVAVPLASLGGALSFLTMVAVGLYLYGSWRHRMHVLGVVLLPLALLLELVSGSLPQDTLPVSESLRHPLLWLHIATSSLGVGALFLTFTFSVIYLIQERALKERQSARFFLPLPSLSACDRGLAASLAVGFTLLTAGLIMATIWSANFRGTYQVWQNSRETLALIAWCILAVVVYARLVHGWRGRKSAMLAIVGFAALMLRLLGTPFL